MNQQKQKGMIAILEPVGRNLGLTLFAMFALFPLIWMVICAFKSDAQMYNTVFRFTPTLENFQAVLVGSDYFRAFFQNLLVAGGAVIVTESPVCRVPMRWRATILRKRKMWHFKFFLLNLHRRSWSSCRFS